MNEFTNVSTGGAILKDYYPDRESVTVLQDALRKRRKKRALERFGDMPTESKERESANSGYGLL